MHGIFIKRPPGGGILRYGNAFAGHSFDARAAPDQSVFVQGFDFNDVQAVVFKVWKNRFGCIGANGYRGDGRVVDRNPVAADLAGGCRPTQMNGVVFADCTDP